MLLHIKNINKSKKKISEFIPLAVHRAVGHYPDERFLQTVKYFCCNYVCDLWHPSPKTPIFHTGS